MAAVDTNSTADRVLARRKDNVQVNPRLMDINILIDRSGSMDGEQNNVIEGVNKLISDNQQGEGEALLSLVQFDDKYEPDQLRTGVNVKECPYLAKGDFVPRGGTRLFDAFVRKVNEIDGRLALIKDPLRRPGKIVLAVFTDGGENDSQENQDHGKIEAMIKDRRDNQSWTIVFVGCDEAGLGQARQAGVGAQNALQFTKSANQGRGMKVAMARASKGISNLRAASYEEYTSGVIGAQGPQGSSGACGTEGIAAVNNFAAYAQLSEKEEEDAANWRMEDRTKQS